MKKFIWILVLIIIAVGGYMLFARGGSKEAGNINKESGAEQTENTGTANQPEVPVSGIAASFALSEVALHPDAKSCWTAVNGNIYNLTPWINMHPGGAENILKICGKDGSQAFNKQHGGQENPAKALAEFFIGTLK